MECAAKYVREGHPTIEELMAEQRVPAQLKLEDFPPDLWPEDDVEDFLAALRDWRGFRKTEPAA